MIIRVFPRRNSYTPTDDLAFFGNPPLSIPKHDEIHICCVFTWDIEQCRKLQFRWQGVTDKPVLLGGPAFGESGGEFVAGRYVKAGVVFTSRGCENSCKWCFVPAREGRIRELPIVAGNIIQDNNFLACSKTHRAKAYEMLKTQKAISFQGGLEPLRLTDWDIEQLVKLGSRLKYLFLAADTKNRLPVAIDAINRLRAAGISKNKIRCYTLIGDDMDENLSRCEAVFNAGALPSAQLFQPEQRIEYSHKWRAFQRVWEKPICMKGYMKNGIKDWEPKEPEPDGILFEEDATT